MKTIGIIGGAGPMASCLLYKYIIEVCQKILGCKNDNDFPEIIIESYPFSPMLNLDESKENRKQLLFELQLCINKLRVSNVQIVTIACNTLSTFLDETNLYDLGVLNIISATLERAREKKLSKLFVLGTPTTIASKMYEKNDLSISYPSKDDQKIVGKIIDNILAGKINKLDALQLRNIVKEAGEQETCDGVILGCTELSVLQEKWPIQITGIDLLDPLRIATEKLIGPT